MNDGRLRRFSGAAIFAGFVVFFGIFFLPAEIGKLMASGDAAVESIPALIGARHVWETSLLLGYPLYADPNQQRLYPLAWIAGLPHLYNAFAIAPFPIAAFGMWGFVRAATRSSLGGIVAGFAFALGGFMISHAGHLMLSHPAAWVPYVLWSIERQRHERDARAIAAGAVAVGLCAVSGQPQILAFALALAVTYAIASARTGTATRQRFAIDVALTLAIGIGLGCVQLVPEAVLAHGSTRSSLALADYTVLEIPANQLAMRAIFPYALGVTRLPGYAFSGADLGTFTEDTIAVGIVPLFLASLSLWSVARDRRIAYWFAVAAIALLLAVGDATPLAALTHRMPLYGLFRIPGRHAFEWTLAIAVLAGYGTSALRDGRASLRALATAVGLLLLVVGLAYVQFTNGAASYASFVATTFGVAIRDVASPTSNGALGIPLALGLICVVSICIAARLRLARAVPLLIPLAVAVDAGTFAYAAYWNWAAIAPAAIEPAPFVARLAERLDADGTRVAWLPGNLAPALAPNLTTLWGVPTVDGYSPLVPTRTAGLLDLTPSGGIGVPRSRSVNLDVAGVSIVAAPAVPNASVSAVSPFALDTIHLFFSATHADGVTHAELGLPKPAPATSIAYVSELGESVDVPQNADVATITVTFENGTHEKHEILAGRDTSEFAFDRPDVRPLVKHARATIYQSAGPGHTYVANAAIDSYEPIVRLAIDLHEAKAALTLEKMSLVDARTGTARAFDSLASLYADPAHWQPIAIDPSIVTFENARALPHAWIANPLRSTMSEIPAALRNGTFDAAREALVEDAVGPLARAASADRVTLERGDAADVVETVTCARACFVVDRDALDSAWAADVDGVPARTFPADLDLRGVVVPEGTHRLRFHFFPISLVAGAALTLVSALAALVLLSRSRAPRAS